MAKMLHLPPQACVVLFIFTFLCGMSSVEGTSRFPALDHLVPQASEGEQEAAAQGLIQRLVPLRALDFIVKVDKSLSIDFKDAFQLLPLDGKIQITGSSGVAVSTGFYYYLTQYCGCHISWAGVQASLPATLPAIPKSGIKIVLNDRFRYYQNVCTVSYSFVWWDWRRWEQEIDWMAMSGINLPLAFNGQEAIWQRVYSKMGFTDEELGKHFGGAAFLAWARMGNMHGWGGPLSQSWHTEQVELQHVILARMRSLGMIPVLPAFAGHVPETFSRIFPRANTSKLGDWGSFNSTYCCTNLLDVQDPLFSVIGAAFIKEYTSEFGTDHIYNTDTFNEMTPKSSAASYLRSAGQAVYKGMTAGDSKAIWLMQGWLFQMSGFWKPEQAKALVTSVPQGRMIILDLGADYSPIYTRLQSYYGQPFIWCMLHNFGGINTMYGDPASVNNGPFEGRSFANSTMLGIGLTPEGINQNDIMYEFMNENAWRTQPRNISQWFTSYPTRRYGKDNSYAIKAWNYLQRSVYNCTSNNCGSFAHEIITSRPSLTISPRLWYQPEDIFNAWENMQQASSVFMNSELFRYDLVDVARQSLQTVTHKMYQDLVNAYKKNDTKDLQTSGEKFLELLSDLDMLLATDEHFLLGRWIQHARMWGTNQQEADFLEYNARNQVTLWGPNGEILDYAAKHWAGLVKWYYMMRWRYFITSLQNALIQKKPFDQTAFNTQVFHEVESPFTFSKTTIPWQPQGDQIKVSQQLLDKYKTVMSSFRKAPTSEGQAKLSELGHRKYSDQLHASHY